MKVKITGNETERFLNLCKNKNIIIWNINPKENCYEMYIDASEFKKLKPLLRKTRTKIKICQKNGFAFQCRKYQKRKMFVIGFIMYLFLILIMSTRVWNIDINGNRHLTVDQITDYLDAQNVYIGMPKSKLNLKKLSANIRKKFSEVLWVSVSIDGTVLKIELKENNNSYVKDTDVKTPSNLISNASGKIVEMVIRSGVPMIREGDQVAAGDILISGEIPIYNDGQEIISYQYVKSDGDIWIEIKECCTFKVATKYKYKKYEEQEKYQAEFQLGNIRFSSFYDQSENKELVREEMLCFLPKLKVPISFSVVKQKNYNYEIREYTKKEKEELLNQLYKNFYESIHNEDCIIVEDTTRIIHEANCSYLIGVIEIHKKIGINCKIIALSSDNMLQ